MTSSWFFLSTLNYDARSTTHQIYKKINLYTSVGPPPGGSSTVHTHTHTHTHAHTIHRTTLNKLYIEQHKNFGRVRAVPRLCGFYPGICLTTEEKAQKNLIQVSRRVPAGTVKIHKHTIRMRIILFTCTHQHTHTHTHTHTHIYIYI